MTRAHYESFVQRFGREPVAKDFLPGGLAKLDAQEHEWPPLIWTCQQLDRLRAGIHNREMALSLGNGCHPNAGHMVTYFDSVLTLRCATCYAFYCQILVNK